ncbi:S8 family serine peptidase [Micromonospora sp. NPDC049679]|uniref:S8 family peptidase n=1 Tax=Micromonospora sp. NPDC049679 TaxID=3155920 RepID=UPI0033F9825C
MAHDRRIRLVTRSVLVGAVTLLGLNTAVLPASADPTGPAILQEGAAGAVKDSYIVVFRADAPEFRRAAVAAGELSRRYGAAVRRSFTASVRGFSATMPRSAARRLAGDPSVAYVEQDRLVRLDGAQADPPWGLDRLDQRDLPLSRSYTTPRSVGVTAYVLDTGIRTSHRDFGGRARYGWDFVDNAATGGDCNGHGTHVAGTIGGTTYGVAKDVSLVAVRVLDCTGYGRYSQIIAGVDWVTAHAVKPAVANMSLGGPGSTALDDAVRRSVQSGVTYAVSAGNDNVDACTQSPARAAVAITVGATDRNDVRASFSNYGRCLDLFAPGVQIASAGHASDTAVATKSGTSMSSPHVAGAAALLLSAKPGATPAQVQASLSAAATTGKVGEAGTGSANLLLRAPAPAAPASAPAPVVVKKPPAPPRRCGPFTAGKKMNIRDFRTVSSSARVAGCSGKAAKTSKVQVRIKHTHRGSLQIDLVAPDRSVYRLKSTRRYDSKNNLYVTYTVNLSREYRNGTWTLRVRDTARWNSGQLVAWTFTP